MKFRSENMKKMTKIIPVLSIVIISLLVLVYLDFKEASKYLKIDQYKREMMTLRYEDCADNVVTIVNQMQELAKKHHVILGKTLLDSDKKQGQKVYLSLDTMEELKQFLKKNFKTEFYHQKATSNSFIATYQSDDQNQIGMIKDLFGDHAYRYYLMNQIKEDKSSLLGHYYIFYQNDQDYEQFVSEVNSLVGSDTKSDVFFTDTGNAAIVVIIGCLIFLLLFYFIFQVYEYYNHSQKIGCMKLLGFDLKKINKNMIAKNMKLYLLSIPVIEFILFCLIKNMTWYHLLVITLVNLGVIAFTYLVSMWSCKIINKSYQTTNILKKQNTTLKISKVSYRVKIIMIVIMICSSVFALENADGLFESLKAYHQSKKLFDYGVLSSVAGDQPELFDYENHQKLYHNIKNNFETFYAQFQDYSQMTNQDWENMKLAEEEGTFFSYDSVDQNYLEKEKIKVYDLNGKQVKIDTIEGVYFLFPKSKKKYIKPFEKYVEEEFEQYRKFDQNAHFQAYLYDDQKIDTYSVNVDYKYIESPILRVIDDSIDSSYINDSLGVSTFGNGINTGLKIKLIDGDKEKTWNQLQKYIDEAGYANFLSQSSFVAYQDFFNDEILMRQVVLGVISTIIFVTFIVYTLISFQLLKLYIKGQRQTVGVKKLLGFENKRIFSPVLKKNLSSSMIAIMLSFFILLAIKKLNIVFVILSLVLFVIDYLITIIAIKTTKQSNLSLDLKGGNYD